MSPDDPHPKPKHRSFSFTPERDLTTRHRIARSAIIIYFVTFLLTGVVWCYCPGFFVIMAVCAIVAIFYGTRFQRFLSTGLLLVALAGFVVQLRLELQQKEHRIERARHVKQLNEQRNQGQ
jgi:hypothetical protein